MFQWRLCQHLCHRQLKMIGYPVAWIIHVCHRQVLVAHEKLHLSHRYELIILLSVNSIQFSVQWFDTGIRWWTRSTSTTCFWPACASYTKSTWWWCSTVAWRSSCWFITTSTSTHVSTTTLLI